MMNKYIKHIYQKIKEYETIVIVRHVNSDMDALGSQFGLAEWIKLNFPNKKVYCLGENHHKYTKNFIPKSDNYSGKDAFLGICVDVNTIDRIDGGEIFSKASYKICIDHHKYFENHEFDYIYINSDLIACAELIASMLLGFKKKMDSTICKYLYAGIYSDSGKFFYPATTSNTLRVAAQLLDIGNFNAYFDIHLLIGMDNLRDLEITSYLVNKLKVDENGFGYYINTKEELKKLNITPSFANEQIDSFNKIEEINIMLAVSECDDDTYRCSVRSKNIVVNEVAVKYGGGGHKFACGVKGINKETLDKFMLDLALLLK